MGFYRLPGSRDTYVDAVCSLANPETYPSCERKAGWLAEHKARAKNRDHPIFDNQTHRRMHPFDFCALSFERHGFWAKETVGFIKKFASSRKATQRPAQHQNRLCNFLRSVLRLMTELQFQLATLLRGVCATSPSPAAILRRLPISSPGGDGHAPAPLSAYS